MLPPRLKLTPERIKEISIKASKAAPKARTRKEERGKLRTNPEWPLASQIGSGASRTWLPLEKPRSSGGRKERRKMAWTRAKRMGPVAYYLYRDAKSYQAGKPSLHSKFGPYASMKEAEKKRED